MARASLSHNLRHPEPGARVAAELEIAFVPASRALPGTMEQGELLGS
jgi:hypothetical protein